MKTKSISSIIAGALIPLLTFAAELDITNNTSHVIRAFIAHENPLTKKITYQTVGVEPDYLDAGRTLHVSSRGANPFVTLEWTTFDDMYGDKVYKENQYVARIPSSKTMLLGKITIKPLGKYTINFNATGAHSWMNEEREGIKTGLTTMSNPTSASGVGRDWEMMK